MMDKWASQRDIEDRLTEEPVGTFVVLQRGPVDRRIYLKFDKVSWRRLSPEAPKNWWGMMDNEGMAEWIHAMPFGTPWSLS